MGSKSVAAIRSEMIVFVMLDRPWPSVGCTESMGVIAIGMLGLDLRRIQTSYVTGG